MRANVYIDGFNFYYGAVREHPEVKWLNLESYCRTLLLKDQELHRIRYFTATVQAHPGDEQQPARQAAYLDAIESLESVTVHKGQFRVNRKTYPLAKKPKKFVTVLCSEEKGTDVSLASYLLMDAFKNDAEAAIVVSDDYDLIEPMKMVRSELGVKLGVVSPRGRPHLSKAVKASFYRMIRPEWLTSHQLPDEVKLRDGRTATRPQDWR